MSLVRACVVCDARLPGYNGNTRCDRCKEPCQTCGGDVAHCHHPLRASAVGGLKLAELSKAQWDAARTAADAFRLGNPALAADRAAYRAAKAKLAQLLPPGADASAIIIAATRWSTMNDLGAVLAGLADINPRGGSAPNKPLPSNHERAR